MAHSLIIRNALIVDGGGGAPFPGEIAVSEGKITEIGSVMGSGAVEIDAGGKVVAPGFIDVHTHYDPQLCWDKLATPTPEHGVTSLIIGNCSVSLAPVAPDAKNRLIGWFGSVEDMDSELMRASVEFDWETVEEYLAQLRPNLGPNVGVFVGHAVIRAYVMGAAAQERAATDDEIERMQVVLRNALQAGAFGLSFTFNHLDDQGNELPCRYADRRELAVLLREVAEAGRMAEVAPDLRPGADTLSYYDLFGSLSIETGVRVSLSPILVVRGQEDWRQAVKRLESWRSKGARIFAQTQVRPLDMTVSLAGGSPMLGKTPLWRMVMDAPVRDRITMLGDPANRQRLVAEIEQMPVIGELEVRTASAEQNKPFIGRKLRDLAEETGRMTGELFIEIALADNLEAEFMLTGFVHADADAVASLLRNPAIHIGSADAGAHISSFSGAGDTCYLFEKFVRTEKALSLEHAVQRLTSDIARDWGLAGRGEIKTGYHADLVIFDPDTIARQPERWVEDLPASGGRYIRAASGIAHVIVNGEVLVNGADYTAARPGHLL